MNARYSHSSRLQPTRNTEIMGAMSILVPALAAGLVFAMYSNSAAAKKKKLNGSTPNAPLPNDPSVCPAGLQYSNIRGECVFGSATGVAGEVAATEEDVKLDACFVALAEQYYHNTYTISIEDQAMMETEMMDMYSAAWAKYRTPAALADSLMHKLLPVCEWSAMKARAKTWSGGDTASFSPTYAKVLAMYQIIADMANRVISVGTSGSGAPEPGLSPDSVPVSDLCPPNYFYDALHEVCCPDGYYFDVQANTCRPDTGSAIAGGYAGG